MALADQPLRTAEFLAVDVETNGAAGDACELTEVGTVLVGGGELHDRFESLVRVTRPLSRGIQRFTGITQAMVAEAAPPERVLRELSARMTGRALVAHGASFDRRVLRQAFERAELPWPNPPVLCTIALARRLAPLVRQRKLAALASSLGIDVEISHRALADAETCARVFCALFGRLCANAATVGEATVLLAARRRRRARRRPPPGHLEGDGGVPRGLDLSGLPRAPGVYVFRDGRGQALYVGKSVSLRARARAHFRPGAERAGWTAHAAMVEHRETRSELGALVIENRLIKALRPPGNVRLRRTDAFAYLRCRLDIPFPILEVAREPAPGHGVTIGPLRGRASAVELMEQLNSVFGLRHCGRRLRRRDHPSAYGQMGRCLSPCLSDLDPNLYRRRLDAALAVFTGADDGREALLTHLDTEMRAAAAAQRYERAASLRRRRDRIAMLLDRLGGVLCATHARPRLVAASASRAAGADGFWLAGGRLMDWGELPAEPGELERRTAAAVARAGRPGATAHVPPDEVDEVRIVSTWLVHHEADVATLALDPAPDVARLTAFAAQNA